MARLRKIPDKDIIEGDGGETHVTEGDGDETRVTVGDEDETVVRETNDKHSPLHSAYKERGCDGLGFLFLAFLCKPMSA